MNYYDMGYYLTIANLSDMASMGAKALDSVPATVVPKYFYAKDFNQLIRGIKDVCENCGTEFIGGDTGQASVISLVGTAFGIVKRDKILKRSCSNVSDLVYTIGKESILKNKLIPAKAKFKEAYLLAISHSVLRVWI